jgi:DNA mismatch repair protein MutL
MHKESLAVLKTGISGKIHVLPGEVVSRIAAGEVVERPAAVVKELVENSLDAGSGTISVEVKDGGLTLIRVTDDGEGMSREDAPRAFERHATSKLRSDADLWSLRTMGFRGEALPSIASISNVRVLTAAGMADVGATFEIQGGVMGAISDAPPIAGTRIDVADLFFNQPARKKFLKAMSTEFSHISRVLQQAALAWPAVHFRLLHNGQEVFNFPAVSSAQDRIGQVYGRLFLDHSLSVDLALPPVKLSGVIIDAVHAKSTRAPQELFVNRRPVRNAAVFHAVVDAYGSFLAKGHHALFVLFLEVDPDRVDVNVHPTKREVRFSDHEMIHQVVRRAVRQALGASDQSSGPPTFRSDVAANARPFTSRSQEYDPPSSDSPKGNLVDQPSRLADRLRRGQAVEPVEEQLAFVSEAAEPYVRMPLTEVQPLGQLNRTFLVVQIGGDLVVIDQHTAHERVLFERLYRAWVKQGIESQPLLIPESIELSPPQMTLLQRHVADLEKLGLEIEPFGSSAVMIRAVPVGLGNVQAETLIQDLLDDISQWDRSSSGESRVRPVLASLACHGAVRSGREMALPEIQALVADWMAAGAITTCPHGRRTSFRLSTQDLEKMFGRANW